MLYHYTYLIRNKINKKKYIGVRTSKCLPEYDKYWGSCKTLTESITNEGIYNFKKRVLNVWSTREEAVAHEIKLHKRYNVAKNSKFYNKSRQTSTGFDYDCTGRVCSDETKRKMGLPKIGVPRSDETKRKLSIAHTGKKQSAELKEWRSVTSMGDLNNFYGKQHSIDTREKIKNARKHQIITAESNAKRSKTLKERYKNNDFPLTGSNLTNEHKQNVSKGMKGVGLGEKYYNNGIVIRRFVPGTEDVGFVLGRTF